jgi:acyl-CoA thioester hydrolase
MKRTETFPAVEQVRQLPVQWTMTVPPEWEDRNGHVNVQYYQTLYELGGYRVLEELGFGDDALPTSSFGVFDLEHHLHFRAELRVGDQVSCYNRIIAAHPKRFHGIYFIVNDSADRLACTLEYITAGADLRSRRTAPFPVALLAGLERQAARGQALPWRAPLCGVMAL